MTKFFVKYICSMEVRSTETDQMHLCHVFERGGHNTTTRWAIAYSDWSRWAFITAYSAANLEDIRALTGIHFAALQPGARTPPAAKAIYEQYISTLVLE